MKKTVTLCGNPVTLVNNALLPRRYRNRFGQDLLVDMQEMVDAYKEKKDFKPEVLENITWLMLKEGGEQVGETPEEWLAGLDDPFCIYEIMGDVVALWNAGRKTTSVPKKK